MAASSNDETVGTVGPNSSGLPQLGLPLLPMPSLLCFACERTILHQRALTDYGVAEIGMPDADELEWWFWLRGREA